LPSNFGEVSLADVGEAAREVAANPDSPARTSGKARRRNQSDLHRATPERQK
jgi:hypothetical protein